MGTEQTQSMKDDYQRISEETKQELIAWAEKNIKKTEDGNISDSGEEFEKLKKTESKTVQF